MSNPLLSLFPRWITDCQKSAEWLRSDKYLAFCEQYGIQPDSLAEREHRAKEYETRAAAYAARLQSLSEGKSA